MQSKINLIKSLIAEKGVTKSKVAERCGINYHDFSRALGGREKQVREDKLDVVMEYLERVNTNDLP